jgi:hypothetical protein
MAGIKLTNAEINKRVDQCLDMRYNASSPCLQREWIAYCHEAYGDKSEQQYHAYWSMARERYEENWRAKLSKMLSPAMDELFNLLADDDPKIRQRAIDQIVKYTGNDIDKIEAKIDGNIELNWGEQDTGYGKEL